MDAYSFSLALGAAGLAVMGVSGLAHSHVGHAAARGSHVGHHAGGKIAPTRGAAGRGAGSRGGGARGAASRGVASRLAWALLSPRLAFALLLGFGAVGVAVHGIASGIPRLLVAALGAIVFERAVVAPLWRFFLRFESAPALTLESCIGDEVRAATNFDANGSGIVAIELDGQMIQLLGQLRAEDRASGIRIRAGEPLYVDEVDAARNRCIVRALPS